MMIDMSSSFHWTRASLS